MLSLSKHEARAAFRIFFTDPLEKSRQVVAPTQWAAKDLFHKHRRE